MENSSPVAARNGRIDTACLEEILALRRPGKPDLLKKVINEYFVDGARLVETVRNGYSAGDTEVVKGASHRLKSSSAMLGALFLAENCEELEHICREGQLPTDITLITAIAEDFTVAKAQLELFMDAHTYDT